MLKIAKGRSKNDETLFLLSLCEQALQHKEGLVLHADDPILAALKIYRLRGYYSSAKLVFPLTLEEPTDDGGNLILARREP